MHMYDQDLVITPKAANIVIREDLAGKQSTVTNTLSFFVDAVANTLPVQTVDPFAGVCACA